MDECTKKVSDIIRCMYDSADEEGKKAIISRLQLEVEKYNKVMSLYKRVLTTVVECLETKIAESNCESLIQYQKKEIVVKDT